MFVFAMKLFKVKKWQRSGNKSLVLENGVIFVTVGSIHAKIMFLQFYRRCFSLAFIPVLLY